MQLKQKLSSRLNRKERDWKLKKRRDSWKKRDASLQRKLIRLLLQKRQEKFSNIQQDFVSRKKLRSELQ